MSNYCRLCAEFKDSSEIIASIGDQEKCIEQKLIACCQWDAQNTDQILPQSVCSYCFEKLDQCWLFSQSVQHAQQKLQEIFGKICHLYAQQYRFLMKSILVLSILYRECGGNQASGIQSQTYVRL